MLPWIVRHLYYPFSQWVQGEHALDCLPHLERSQWESADRLQTLQFERLNALLQAARRVPYYAAVWKESGFDGHLTCMADLSRLPLLTREQIRNHGPSLERHGFSDGRVETQTSGSSGSPLRVYHSRTFRSWHEAGQIRARRWFGVEIGDRTLVVWGRPIKGQSQWYLQRLKNWLNNIVSVSAWDLSPKTVALDWRILHQAAPHFVYAYPSAIYEIARLALSGGWPLPSRPPRVVMTTAETLHDVHRETIAAAFRAPVANVYGCAELGAFAHECPRGSMHIAAENVLVEVLRDGVPAAPGESGDIVLTALHNRGMPLIRYAVGDKGALRPGACECGRQLPRMTIHAGKEVELVSASNGRIFSSALFDYVNKQLVAEGEVAARFRVLQTAPDTFVVQVVSGDANPLKVERAFQDLLAEHIPGARVRVELVPELARDPGGKQRFFIRDPQGFEGNSTSSA